MTQTRAVNLRYEPYDVYVGRAGHGMDGRFGNPFPVMGARGESLALFRGYFSRRIMSDMVFLRDVLLLRGKRLGCFCHPMPCHAMVYVDFVENFPVEWADALLAELDARLGTRRTAA